MLIREAPPQVVFSSPEQGVAHSEEGALGQSTGAPCESSHQHSVPVEAGKAGKWVSSDKNKVIQGAVMECVHSLDFRNHTIAIFCRGRIVTEGAAGLRALLERQISIIFHQGPNGHAPRAPTQINVAT